jgi:transposase
LQPHRSRYWLNHKRHEDPASFDRAVKQVCDLYDSAPALHQAGVHVMSSDEKTGIQALDRKYPDRPMQPGRVRLQEHEYIRHGTQALMANLEVATGRCVAPSIGDRRQEADFVAHIAQTVALDPEGAWIFIVDQLNTHQSASLVRWVAQACGLSEDLGVKGKAGILQSQATRAAFLQEETHRIRFVYTPVHTSWLNQIEVWFSILVRRLLQHGSFSSVDELRERILAFIDYFNRTMARPFKWTYAGRPLQA